MPGAKRKQSLYFPAEMLKEIKAEADRLDRSMSWVVQRAWKNSRDKIKSIPGEPPVVVDPTKSE